MANLTTCPFCGADIEDDSLYCDQCGNELYACPSCGNLCKGKFCPKCGKPTQLARNLAGAGPRQAGTAASPVQPGPRPANPAGPAPAGPMNMGAPSAGPANMGGPSAGPANMGASPRPTTNPGVSSMPGTGTFVPGGAQAPACPRLVCRAMGVAFNLAPGTVIGRVTGDYASQLGMFQYLSGTQARVDCTGGQWTITDLGSRNGTAVNGQPCSPTLPFRQGDVIRFSRFYDFQVE